jgi:hypothetical protein
MIYIERAPDAWVEVCAVEEWNTFIPHERNYLVSRALKVGRDQELPRT